MISRRSMLLYSMVLAAVSSRLDPASAQSAAEGGKIYAAYCSTCHGEAGKGNGIAARSLPVKPGDHTDGAIMNRLSDKFLVEIISKGGAAVGKSIFMPAWASSFDEEQIRNIVEYLRSIAIQPFKAGKATK